MQKKVRYPASTAVIVAAGNSQRMGKDINKQFLFVKDIPVLARTLKKFDEAKSITDVIVVTKPEFILTINDIIKEYQIKKVSSIIPGGNTRQESVLCGLKLVDKNRIVAIHDGSRPFVSVELINNLISSANELGAVAPGIMPKDTVKETTDSGTVSSTLERSRLCLIQTPQVFRAQEVLLAHLRAEETGFLGTDDCSLLEQMGIEVHIVKGEETNIKITTPYDIPIAEAICEYLNE